MKKLIKLVAVLAIAFIIFVTAKAPVKEFNIVRDAAPFVVPYRVLSKGNKRFATGFHLKYRGKVYIMTNKHVCDSNIRTYNHGNIQFDNYVGKIIAIDTVHDLCLVTSNRSDGLELAEEQSKVLDKVSVIGFPRGMGKVIREGRIIGDYPILAPWLSDFTGVTNSVQFLQKLKTVDSIQISVIAYGGNSGSPILNEKGKVTGVLFAGHRHYHTETYIVPLLYVKLFLAFNAK